MRYLSGLLLLVMGLGGALTSLASAQTEVIIGYTQYDLQSVGSTGRRIVVDTLGGLHFTWMCGDPYPNIRSVKYNCLNDTISPWPHIGTQVSDRNGAGFAQIAFNRENRAFLVFHQAFAGAETLFYAIDNQPPYEYFERGTIPNEIGNLKFGWPYVAVDHQGRIQIVSANINPVYPDIYPFEYTRSNNGGTTWTAPSIVDTVMTLSPIIVASRVSDKVAIVYTHPADSTGLRNDIYYVESTDGVTWNGFLPKNNITNYGVWDARWAWAEVSALYDNNDNLHIIWNGQYIVPQPYPHYTVAGAHLFHYDVASGSINRFGDFYSSWPDSVCNFGDWNFAYAKFSIAADRINNLYVAYTSWDPTDCSMGGYANGDIFLQYSTDNGVSWMPRINLTNSQTPNCSPGNCQSDNWGCLAEVADTSIHLFYVNDHDAGAIPYWEGMVTDNPMLYLSYSQGLPLAVKDDPSKPKSFALAQNYPNPFNAQTTISYNLKESGEVTLLIYNLIGEKVAVLFRGMQEAGEHQAVWDAATYSSGVYFAKLEAEKESQSIRMVLLK